MYKYPLQSQVEELMLQAALQFPFTRKEFDYIIKNLDIQFRNKIKDKDFLVRFLEKYYPYTTIIKKNCFLEMVKGIINFLKAWLGWITLPVSL